MPHYLIQVAYNTSGTAGLVKEPQNRVERVTPAIEALGGRVECGYFAFGEYDICLICEMPDNTSAAAFALAAGAGGTVASYRTTVLLTPDEAVEAMSKAAESGYEPAPG
ncbi:MAG: GYD domain-containing protein [Thermoleophilaceae bacterium]|nr:GYD domain-containing protein [Thermoleophilaceae bacterium]